MPLVPLVKVHMPPRERLLPALEAVLYSGQVGEGDYVRQFEAAFCDCFGVGNAIAMSSGTAALHAALVLAGVGPSDEVISTPMTAEPTNLAILHAGGRVVFADVEPDSGNLDPASVRQRITALTKAIVVVHYAGTPAKTRELRALADEHGIKLIEDCAHALGAMNDGRPVGTIGHYAIFSFQAIKHITTIDGGILLVESAEDLAAARKFLWFGIERGVARTEIDVSTLGYKYNMHNVAACIGLAQLELAPRLLDSHRANGNFFDLAFSKTTDGTMLPARVPLGASSSYWVYTLLSDHADQIIADLNAAGFLASKLHQPSNRHTIFSAKAQRLPGLESFHRRLVHLPCGWWVTPAQRAEIVNVVNRG